MRFGKRRVDPIAEEQAFLEGVYSRMKPLLHKLILSQGATETEAEDILQESFLRLWQKVEYLQELPERKCFNYVYTTVRNTALSHLKGKSRRLTQPLDEDVPAPAGRDRRNTTCPWKRSGFSALPWKGWMKSAGNCC